MTNKKSFTLIELLVVVAIIGILAAVGTPIFQGFMLDAKINASIAKHQNIRDFISANLVRCSTGASSIKLQEYYGQQSISCSETPWNLAIAFAKHFKYTNMGNPYGNSSGLTVYASSDACLPLGVTTIWGSSNANQGRFVRVTTRFKEDPNSCSNNGREQTYILIE
jgi:type IV pilus assembly protein PilA